MHQAATYNAFYKTQAGPGTAIHADIIVRFATREEAEKLTAKFPKYVKARTVEVRCTPPASSYFWTRITASLAADGVNGGRNETGIKRIHTAEQILAREGIDLDFGVSEAPYPNLYHDRAAYDAAIA